MLLGITGAVVAYLWLRVNLGSKFWQSRWEQRLHVVERQLDHDMQLFSAEMPQLMDDVRQDLDFGRPDKQWIERLYDKAVLRKPSVTKSMTVLSVFFIALWLFAALLSQQRDAGRRF